MSRQTITTIAEIENLNLGNEHRKNDFISMLALRNQINPLYPCSFEYDKENDHTYLVLDKENEIYISRNYRGQFSVYSHKRFDNVDNYKISEIRSKVKAPNNFKALSSRKIQEWVWYCRDVNALCKQFSEECTVKIAKFLAKIDSLSKQGNALHLYNDGKSGHLTNEYFELHFEIQTNGYIKKDLRFAPYGETLEHFENLSKLLK